MEHPAGKPKSLGPAGAQKPTKGLIYLCSLGAPTYRAMAELCVRSLRGPGMFVGPIVVFTDNGFRSRDPEVEVISVPPIREAFDRYAFKPQASRLISFNGCEKVLYMDVDMLAIDDIGPLFDYGGGALCAVEEVPPSRMTDPLFGECLTPAEARTARRRRGINSGLICAPRDVFRDSMELWLKEMRRQRKKLDGYFDQPPFNALVLRGALKFKTYPKGWIEMPPKYFWGGGRFRVKSCTKVLHLCWPEKKHTITEMRVLLEALEGSGRPIRALQKKPEYGTISI